MKKYLDICPLNHITITNYLFSGIIKNTSFSPHLNISPSTYLLEGIHQFAVRITTINDPASKNPNEYRLPSQIKTLSFHSQIPPDDHLIEGNYITLDNFYLVSFNVLSKDKTLIADGKIYIAKIIDNY